MELDGTRLERLFGTFFDITSLMHAGRERDIIFARVLECAVDLLEADECSILIVQDGHVLRYWRATHGGVQREEFPSTPAVLEWLEREREPFLGSPGQWRAPVNWERLMTTARALVCAPLVAKEIHLGLLVAVRSEQPDEFTAGHLKILTALANQTAIALENAELYERIQHEAVTDGLTGVYNYKTLMHTLRTEMRRAQRYGHQLTFIMADVDYLKTYNDRFGHMAGSEVLAELAKLLVAHCRNTDVVGKYGGDEFAIILPQTGLEGAIMVAERMRAAIAEQQFKNVSRGEITCSFGLACFPEDATDVHELVSAADQQLFQAKRSGKNRLRAKSYTESSTAKPATTELSAAPLPAPAAPATIELLCTPPCVASDPPSPCEAEPVKQTHALPSWLAEQLEREPSASHARSATPAETRIAVSAPSESRNGHVEPMPELEPSPTLMPTPALEPSVTFEPSVASPPTVALAPSAAPRDHSGPTRF